MGVCFCKQTGKWTSIIVYNKKSIWLGRFDSEIAAAREYDEAAKKYYGEFARLNFPPVAPRRFAALCLSLCFLRNKLRGFARQTNGG